MMAWYFLARSLHRLTWIAVSFGAIVSSTFASIVCNASKYIFLRARPNGNQGPFSFFNFEAFSGGGGTYYSFPSGDVVVVAGAAYFLMLQTKNKILRTVLFLLPITTALARMDANKHWPSDTLLSLGLGLVSALFVRNLVSFPRKRESN
jgi:membrane-associated phospholipid phosphatase